MLPPRPLCALILLAAVASAEDEKTSEWKDDYFGIWIRVPGIEASVGRGDISEVFDGKGAGGVRVTVRMLEGTEPLAAGQWRSQAKDAWAKSRRKRQGESEGETPQPWILFTETRLAILESLHLYAWFTRGAQAFEVHAWWEDRDGRDEKPLRAAIAGFGMASAEQGALIVRRFALEASKAEDDPKVLLDAGYEYAKGGKFRQVNGRIAARVLAQARAAMTPESFKPEERWLLFEVGGSVQPTPEEAVEWYALAEEAARALPPESKRRERLAQSGYNLACYASRAGDLDTAFAALDRAFAEVKPVTDAHVSGDPDLDNCRKDPRWDDFWRKRVKPY